MNNYLIICNKIRSWEKYLFQSQCKIKVNAKYCHTNLEKIHSKLLIAKVKKHSMGALFLSIIQIKKSMKTFSLKNLKTFSLLEIILNQLTLSVCQDKNK